MDLRIISAFFTIFLGGCVSHSSLPPGPDNPEDDLHPAQIRADTPLPEITPLRAGLDGSSSHLNDPWNPSIRAHTAENASTHPVEHSHSTPSTSPSSEEAMIYTCPMHPEVTSSAPGKCLKCGMELQPRQEK
ncbi:MAG: hypothetical protein KatS3mg104_0349 [Phycisphaerae bacterium]|jgi:hypothetical protein|nr:MAG: hypothetical protein KatS3mg104_0349 [Phycisphaerae bacterium]